MMNRLRLTFVLFCLLWNGNSNLEAEDTADSLFREALDGNASFNDSMEKWAEQVRESSFPSAALYYNMGNALALDGDETAALALYSRALSIKPGNGDIRYNRDLLLKKLDLKPPAWSVPEGILWSPVWLFGYHGLWILVGISIFASIIYTMIMIIRKMIPSLPLSMGALIMLVYFGAVLALWENRAAHTAVVQEDEIQLYEGDSPLYPPASLLEGGDEVRILENRDGWVRVRSNSESGEGWCEELLLLKAEELVKNY